MEEGEIHDEGVRAPRYEYEPSFEWPGDDVDDSLPPAKRNRILRFVVLTQSSVTGSGRVALVDSYTELHFGRDASSTGSQIPRIRVKTMEVSKHHATVYWDTQQERWAVVDMGSVHGTFLRPSASESEAGQRLSSARTASMPRVLSHLDTLYLGTTGFSVHIHSELPCEDCSPRSAKDEISLFPSTPSRSSTPKASPVVPSPELRTHPYAKDSRKAISALKRELLAHHQPSTPSSYVVPDIAPGYVDRSARRRALYPSSASEAPGVAPRRSSPTPPVPTVVAHEPAVPLSSSNVGHRLLMKQGWEPGSSLGLSDEGVVEPLDGAAMAGSDRRGLGVHRGR